MKQYFVISLILLSWTVTAQKLTISGRVVDRSTKEPLIFASIGIKNKPIGTISNFQGEFDFHIPSEYRNEIFVISMLGYNSYEKPVWAALDGNAITIELEPSAQMLREVVVADTLTGGEILQIALSRVDSNYASTPFLMEGFYRDIKKIGGTNVLLLEAAVKIFDEDYKAPRNKFKLHERVMVLALRRNLGYSTKFTTFFDDGNLLEDLLLNNSVRYRQFPEEIDFFNSLHRQEDTQYNGRPVYVINTITEEYTLSVFIDKTNYSILHLEYEDRETRPLSKKRGMVSRFVRLKRVIDFREYNGKMFLNYLTVDSQINWYDVKTNEMKFETELHQQLLINAVVLNPKQRIGPTEKMRSYGLQYQDMPYDKVFWENYNVIKDTPLDKKIIEDLEKEVPLEKQFQDN